jgi:hypothetical protein
MHKRRKYTRRFRVASWSVLRVPPFAMKYLRADKTVCFLGIEMIEGKMYAADASIRKFASKAYIGQNISVLNSYLGYLKLFRTEKSRKKITLPLLESGVYIDNSNNNSLILNTNLV